MHNVWQDRKCLVTGGAGFGGAHLCEKLLACGAQVYVLDKLVHDLSYFRLQGFERHVQMIIGDITDSAFVRLLLERFEINTIFHLAAQPIVPISNTLPMETLHTNAMGTFVLLEAMRQSLFVERMVVASSGAYYGATTTDSALLETDPPRTATNIYASSKVAADAVTRSYGGAYGLSVAVCRFMNTYGPGDINFTRLVPRAIRNLLNAEAYHFGARDDGSSRLDFLYVGDMAEAYMRTAEAMPGCRGESFNFGSGAATSITDVAKKISIRYDGQERTPIFAGEKRERPAIKYLNVDKARKSLGWEPKTALEDGLNSTLEWYRKNWKMLRKIA
ncbi:NAD-dependent epimerase/dehydratase family protein [Acidithiobacillus sp. IBUN Pt1247-S3]|uniref:NAD-dependent epimerase/dehydratase family protein n=1 Tax=Acidithiobacillus sp. IBUN Pt1247-S3 TaxID=3166642 RepID=UPI0034E3EFB0